MLDGWMDELCQLLARWMDSSLVLFLLLFGSEDEQQVQQEDDAQQFYVVVVVVVVDTVAVLCATIVDTVVVGRLDTVTSVMLLYQIQQQYHVLLKMSSYRKMMP